jgi:hypothetical protein
MRFRRSSAGPFLYIINTENGLVIWNLSDDDCLLMRHKSGVSNYHKGMNSYFDCDEIGDLKEYVRWKIVKQERGNLLLITQPYIVRSFMDEFEIQDNMEIEVTATKRDSFSPIKNRDELNEEDQRLFDLALGNF